MKIEAGDLLPGEKRILTKFANSVIRLDQYGLGRIGSEKLMELVGFAGKEGIGGKLHLTNYRLLFKSHRVNRVTGAFSIFLPTIREVADTSRLLSRKVKVVTRLQRFEFVLWGTQSFIREVREQASGLTEQEKQQLAEWASQGDERIGSGLEHNEKLAADVLTFAIDMAVVLKNPLEISNLLGVIDLLSNEEA